MERAQLGPTGSSKPPISRPPLRRIRRQIFKVGGEMLSLAKKGDKADSHGELQP